MSVPRIEAVDLGGNCGLWEQVHVEVRPGQSLSCPTVPRAGLETYLEVWEDFLGRQGLGVAHRGGKDTDS